MLPSALWSDHSPTVVIAAFIAATHQATARALPGAMGRGNESRDGNETRRKHGGGVGATGMTAKVRHGEAASFALIVLNNRGIRHYVRGMRATEKCERLF